MSLYAAMQVAVGGLGAQSDSISNISDNLANAQTTGYKAVTTRFESLVTQSNANTNDPGGVKASPFYTNSVQGNLEKSSIETYLAISGSGYFPVRAAVVGADGTKTFGNTSYYTRSGDFTLDASGYLVNGADYYLTGYMVDEDGVVDTSSCDPIQLSELLDNPVATSSVEYAANLPSSEEDGFTSSPSTIEIYDALGGAHDLTFTWEKTTTTNVWELTITVPDASETAGVYTDYTTVLTFTFNDGSGGTTAGTIASITSDSASTVIDNSASSVNTAEVEFTLDFDGASSETISVDFGTIGKSDGVTQFDDTSLSVSSFDQNGIPRGSFQSLNIDENGYVTLNYDNGRSRTIAQIPIVQFFAEDQLQRVTGGVFSQTLASGTARYSLAGTNGAGSIVSNALEGSNVDIAQEFTKLIKAQQIYSANAKTITTANNMLQEAINIIR